MRDLLHLRVTFERCRVTHRIICPNDFYPARHVTYEEQYFHALVRSGQMAPRPCTDCYHVTHLYKQAPLCSDCVRAYYYNKPLVENGHYVVIHDRLRP